jgi:hypothetical protein
MATQLSVIRGDYLCTQTVNLSSATDDFSNLSCTGQIRAHPDGNLLYQFIPTVAYAAYQSGSVYFDIPASVTKGFPPINLYGDVHFYSTGIKDQTLFEFRLNVLPDVTHL